MLDNKTKISVVNKRGQEYTASLPNGEYYEWMPAVGGIEDSQELEFKHVQYLHMRSSTFKEGYLYIDHDEARKRLGLEKEEVKVATMSHEEIEKLLKGNLTQLKKLENYKNGQREAQITAPQQPWKLHTCAVIRPSASSCRILPHFFYYSSVWLEEK